MGGHTGKLPVMPFLELILDCESSRKHLTVLLYSRAAAHFSRSFIPHSLLERGTGLTPCQICALRSKNWELISELCLLADNRTCSGSSEYEVSLLDNRLPSNAEQNDSLITILMFWQWSKDWLIWHLLNLFWRLNITKFISNDFCVC